MRWNLEKSWPSDKVSSHELVAATTAKVGRDFASSIIPAAVGSNVIQHTVGRYSLAGEPQSRLERESRWIEADRDASRGAPERVKTKAMGSFSQSCLLIGARVWC